ncbi:MAG: hypothetical protein HQL11_05750 [Candidatus Omnitrophica bacterium]|nr:hypothetical protein [Candidatus Omnitrophota bacterium]
MRDKPFAFYGSVITIGALMLTGCATTRQYAMTSYDRPGQSTVVSEEPGSSVSLAAHKVAGNEMMLNLNFVNRSEHNLDVRPSAFELWALDGAGHARPLKVYGAEEYAALSRRKLTTGSVVLGVFDSAASVGGSLLQQSASGIGQIVNLGTQILTNSQVTQKLKQNQQSDAAWLASVQRALLRDHVLPPGGRSGGTVMAEWGKADFFEVVIVLGDEEHHLRVGRPPDPNSSN